MLKVNLEKGAQSLRVSLEKAGIAPNMSAEIAFDIDVSGSYKDEHRDGSVQHLIERLVPWAMVFDPDKKADVFTFSNGRDNAHHVGVITPATAEDYDQRYIIDKVPGWGGGTDLSYVLEKNLQIFGWLPQEAVPVKKPGLFSRILGGSTQTASTTVAEKRQSIVILNTDGENGDEKRTYKVLQDSQQRGDKVYFLFLAYANGGANFRFLREIGDDFSNTGLVEIQDLKNFLALSDQELNDRLLGDELLTWLK
jgi:hypothetical protein